MATEAKILITADASKLDPGLRAATTKLAAFGTKANQAVGRLTTSFQSLGALLAGGVIAAGIKRTVDSLEELSVASQKTGVAVEELAKLKYAAEQLDTPVESLYKGIKFLNQALGAARAGDEKMIESLAALGVTANDTVLPAMIKVADAIQRTPDAADRANKLLPVFKKSWEDLVPLLGSGGQAIKDLADELQRMGGVPSQKAADSANRLKDTISKLGTSISGPLAVAIGAILPTIDALGQRFTNAAEQAGGLLNTFEEIGERTGLTERIRDASNALAFWEKRLESLRQKEAAGDFPLIGGTAELYTDLKTAEEAVAKFTKVIADTRAKFSEKMKATPAVDVLIQGDPNAAAKVTADATAASQAAQAAVPPVIVPIAVGPTGAIGNYADLQAEFARQQEGFAAGGAIRGPGSGTSDSILARVSNGEHVIRAAAVARYGRGFMDAINRMSLPRFAAGGPVGSSQTATYHLNLNGKTLAATAPAGAAADFAAELRREVVRRGRR